MKKTAKKAPARKATRGTVGYVDGFVLVVPKDKLNEYRREARKMAKLCRKYGALDYKECVGDDLTPSMGSMQVMTFPQLTNMKPDETVWFSYIGYTSRKDRDAINAKIMAEMNEEAQKGKNKNAEMPFDMSRMAYGGFKVSVSNE